MAWVVLCSSLDCFDLDAWIVAYRSEDRDAKHQLNLIGHYNDHSKAVSTGITFSSRVRDLTDRNLWHALDRGHRSKRAMRRAGSVAKIHWPHKILWQAPIYSNYRMWSKYFLQQSPQSASEPITTMECGQNIFLQQIPAPSVATLHSPETLRSIKGRMSTPHFRSRRGTPRTSAPLSSRP